MLRRQRTFFLTANQYEPVMLEYTGISSGRLWYRFRRYDDATRYIIKYRHSTDGGKTYNDWTQTDEIGITVDPQGYTIFNFPAVAGLMYECCVIMTGDDKDPSDESNIVTTIYPYDPPQSPPVIDGFSFYYNGRPIPALKVLEIPTGVSSWVVWYREFGNADWINVAIVDNGVYAPLNHEMFASGSTYQFIVAWYDHVNNKILSDVSNVVTIALPTADITYLLPPEKLSTEYYGEYGGGYWNFLIVQRGDMRATHVHVEHKRSTDNIWVSDGDLVIADQYTTDVNERKYYWIQHKFSTDLPIAGEVWTYRLKNKADGLDTSEYSELFTITIPSVLPKLPSPSITLQQEGHSVLVSWSSVTDAVGYKIERRSTSESSWTVVQAQLSPSLTRYDDTGTSYGNTYFYRVTALGDNITYQDSTPTEGSITVTEYVTLPTPVIDSVTESGIGVVLVVSNINAPNTLNVPIEMSENGGAWKSLGAGYPASMSETSFTFNVAGEQILDGGTLRFRARAMPSGMAQEPSPYSEIASITIDEREWLLRWNGTSWDDPSGLTGGWMNMTTTDSEGTHVSNITESSPSVGVKRLQGTGYYRTVNALTENKAVLTSKYKRVWMIGTLSKDYAGEDYHAMFGNMYTYPFSGGTQVDFLHWVVVSAGRSSHPYSAGTVENPNFAPSARNQYGTTGQGPYLFFSFNGGHADVRGILGIKQQ